MFLSRLFPMAVCLLVLTTACTPTVVQQPARERFFWPIPPTEPRLEFIGVYNGSELQKLTAVDELLGIKKMAFSQPSAIAVNSKGQVFVADGHDNAIAVMDFVNESFTVLSMELNQPFGLCFDSKDNLYVVERKTRNVSVYSPEHVLLFRFGEEYFKQPVRIAVDESRDRIYVSDVKLNVVQAFNLKGEYVMTIGRPGRIALPASQVAPEVLENGLDREGEFFRPYGVGVDRDGKVYVSDQGNARVQVFEPDGRFVRTFGVRGDNDRALEFSLPMGLFIDHENRIWMTDMMKQSVMAITLDPEPELYISVYGAGGAEKSQFGFKSPVTVAVDRANRVYVADILMARISVWQYLDKPYLEKNPLPGNWMERKDIMEIWYRDSGLTPPAATPLN